MDAYTKVITLTFSHIIVLLMDLTLKSPRKIEIQLRSTVTITIVLSFIFVHLFVEIVLGYSQSQFISPQRFP